MLIGRFQATNLKSDPSKQIVKIDKYESYNFSVIPCSFHFPASLVIINVANK